MQFPSRDAPDQINRGGSFAVARDSSKISAFVPQEHQIRMRSDEGKGRLTLSIFYLIFFLYHANQCM